MINAEVKLNIKGLEESLMRLRNQRVRVGVLNKSVKSARPDFSKGITTMSSSDSSQSVQRRYVKAKGRQSNPSLFRVAQWLDGRKQIISGAMSLATNREVVAVGEQFAVMDKTPTNIKRLENAARAIVRNPILRREYNPNVKSWAKRKGFDHWGMSTGTLFKNITAVYEAN